MATNSPLVRLWHGADPGRPSRLSWAVLVLSAGGLLIALIAGLLNRFGAISYGIALQVLRYAAFVSIAALVLSVLALLRAATGARRRSWVAALAGAVIAAAWLAVPVYYVTVLYPANPPIHDITTDTEHPPEFVAILPLRAKASNPAAYGGAAIAEQQKRFFPNLGPALLSQTPAVVFPAAVAGARSIGLDIVAAVPEQGRIEANERSLFFGFVDDVVIRVQADGAGTRVDVRSVSRVGESDLGANARRVKHYLAAFQALVSP